MGFQLFFEKVAWGAMAAVILYAATQLKEVTTSVQALNTNVSVLVEKTNNSKERLDLLESRVLVLEQRRRVGN